jgi:hypothetical protein
VFLADASEEVGRAWEFEIGQGLGDGHLDVLARDLVGGRRGINGAQSRHHLVAAGARVGEPLAFGGQVGKRRFHRDQRP